ncbi:MAG: dihydropteroate synthase [Candidatus Omnitrophica bacterium]|nr:dihydropteroate synthase [Candidatus Omnitrophota bacterium]
MKGFEFGSRTYVMGILNVTPDSFSGDGVYQDAGGALETAERFVARGADIIDVGGESTRPGSEPVSLEEEIKRTIPVIERLAKKLRVPISVDTKKAEVAKRALDSGATIINDITGLDSDKDMRKVVARYNASVVIMHIKGSPLQMQQNPVYTNLIEEIIERLSFLVKEAESSGIRKENIIIDPGIGFGKTFEHNLEILNNLSRFKALGKPVLVGPSRKSFIGNILGVEPKERLFGTLAAVAIAVENGADIIRAHDVSAIKQAVMVADAIVRSREAINV